MNRTKKPTNILPTTAALLSAVALLLVSALILQPNTQQISVPSNNIVVGAIFSVLCILGTASAFYPNICEKRFIFTKKTNQKKPHQTIPEKPFKGHHPNCPSFSKNRIQISQFTLCAACTGLVAGAIVALSGATLYFFAGYPITIENNRIALLWSLGMLLGLFQFKFSGYKKLVANSLFVVSALALLITADAITKNFIIDLYVLGTIVFLLLARIMISQWNNRKLCVTCTDCQSQADIRSIDVYGRELRPKPIHQ